MGNHRNKILGDPNFRGKFDFDSKKHLHVKLETEIKREFHAQCYRLGLTGSKVIQRLVEAVIESDEYIIRMLNQIRIDEEKEIVRGFGKADPETLFALMQESDEEFENSNDEED